MLDNQGGMRAVFDSLQMNFTFNKNKLVQQVLMNLFESTNQQQTINLLRAFNNLRLDLFFASS
jgi:hypothetical protein